MQAVAFALCSVAAALCQTAGPERVPLLAGKAFTQALEQPFAASWDKVELRHISRRIAATRGTELLLDRRIDPSREHSIAASGDTLSAFLEKLADAGGGRLSIVGNTAYLGPTSVARKLRTLVYLRQHELSVDGNGIPRARRAELSQPKTFAWGDLSQPSEIVQRIAEQRHLAIDGLDRVPYDLWAAATLPQTSAVEALTLVLIQFDLTFEWIERGQRIRIGPIPEDVSFERGHLPSKGQSAATALTKWREQFPQLEARIVGSELLVRGTIEEHEALDLVQHGAVVPRTPKPSPLKPLKQERFTLRIKNTPVRALVRKLEEPAYGLTFEYDDDALKQAGVDLEQRVTFEVKNARIEELLKAALDPLKLAFELDDRTVRLKAVVE